MSFNKPTFYNDYEHWRLRCTADIELKDIYDGKKYEQFLCEPGNLAFISTIRASLIFSGCHLCLF